jgi:serine/threonine protein kinase
MVEHIGRQLGNYRIIRLLGAGGFAQVYLGEHIYLKTTSAIKVLLANLSDDDLQAFLNEARVIARLRHPQVIRVLEFGIDAGKTPFLVMTYAPHGTLRDRHPKGTIVAQEDIVAYVKQVAAALQYAHDQKLVHRDVKPENMLIGRNNEVLLSDFGIAVTARSTLSQDQADIGGTVIYMAPEQLRGRPRPASDQYSLGVVVYEWLCGKRPFEGNYLQVATQHLRTPPPPLRERLPSLSL